MDFGGLKSFEFRQFLKSFTSRQNSLFLPRPNFHFRTGTTLIYILKYQSKANRLIIVVVFLSSRLCLSIDKKARSDFPDSYNDRFTIYTRPLRPQSSLIYYAWIIKKYQLNSYHRKRACRCRCHRLFRTLRHHVYARRRPKQNVCRPKTTLSLPPPSTPSATHT